jgi:hypothetical protein
MVSDLPSWGKRNVAFQRSKLQHLEMWYMSKNDSKAVDALERQLSPWKNREDWSSLHDGSHHCKGQKGNSVGCCNAYTRASTSIESGGHE